MALDWQSKKCPKCGSRNIKTIDAIGDFGWVYLKKKCFDCGHEWSEEGPTIIIEIKKERDGCEH